MKAVRHAFEVGRRGRLGQALALNGAFLLRATEASSSMTGAVITVGGGYLVSSL